MPKEPGERFSEDSPEETAEEKANKATNRLSMLTEVMADVEGPEEKKIDLNESSRVFSFQGLDAEGNLLDEDAQNLSQEEALETTVANLREYMDYVSPQLKNFAEGLVIRAEIYLADQKSKHKK